MFASATTILPRTDYDLSHLAADATATAALVENVDASMWPRVAVLATFHAVALTKPGKRIDVVCSSDARLPADSASPRTQPTRITVASFVHGWVSSLRPTRTS